MTRAEAKAYRAKIERASATVANDEDALELIDLFPAYQVGKEYTADERFRYKGKLYRVVQAHTSQDDWLPPDVPALYATISVEEYPEWIQPTGAHDAYALGAKVRYNGQNWKSTVEANVWAPGVYGWEAE